jgi:hypothetical protein
LTAIELDGMCNFPGRLRKIIVKCISDFRRRFGSVSQFIGYSPGRTAIDYNTFNLIVTVTLRNYEK